MTCNYCGGPASRKLSILAPHEDVFKRYVTVEVCLPCGRRLTQEKEEMGLVVAPASLLLRENPRPRGYDAPAAGREGIANG